jgi:hypothetical protein
MNMIELENFFIDAQCHEPELTAEEIRYLLERKNEETMSIEVVNTWLKQTKEKADLQKSINNKKANRKAAQLLTDLNMMVSELMDLLTKLKNDSDAPNSSKLQIDTLREIRKSIMDVGTMAGELKKQQEVTISNYYVSIDKINEYIENKKKTSDKLINVTNNLPIEELSHDNQANLSHPL